MTPASDWQHFYRNHPTPDPHSLAHTLLTARKASSAVLLPVKVGVANAVVLAAGIITAAAR